MFRGQETKNQHEIGIQKIVQSPDEIRSMIHHEIRRHQTTIQQINILILSIEWRRRPFVHEITKLLVFRIQCHSIQERDQKHN